ncbi:MAG: phosphoribosylglycinamide formyltransferase [Clostridia bacterium]
MKNDRVTETSNCISKSASNSAKLESSNDKTASNGSKLESSNDKKICRVAVFVSGGGTNLQAIIDACKSGTIKHAKVEVVVSSRADAFALTRAKQAGIPTFVRQKSDFTSLETGFSQLEFENSYSAIIKDFDIDIIVLAGFMCILTENFTSKYPERIINVHPALIPKFCGKGFYGLRVHQAVLDSGETVTGATVHFVNEIPDGGRIISQKEVAVCAGDTPETLQRRVMEEAEWKLLPEAIETVSIEIIKTQTSR